MTRWAFVVGPGRSGTTLLSDLLNRSSRIHIAPETKFFLQVWSQRHLLRLVPRKRRLRRIVDHVVASEYPAHPPVFAPRRDDFVQALEEAPSLEAGFLSMLRTLSDRPVLGEKTPWHTFFVDRIRRAAPDARFVGITRDAPATVASTWKREGFRRVDTLTRCIARWIFMNRELLRVRERLGPDRFHLVRFEDLVREPAATLGDVCGFLDVPLEPQMLHPTFQDSSLRGNEGGEEPDHGGNEPDGSGGGFDTGALERWRDALDEDQIRRVRGHTWRISGRLGYPERPEPAGATERLAVFLELKVLGAGVALMRSGLYPFGAATRRTGRDGADDGGGSDD